MNHSETTRWIGLLATFLALAGCRSFPSAHRAPSTTAHSRLPAEAPDHTEADQQSVVDVSESESGGIEQTSAVSEMSPSDSTGNAPVSRLTLRQAVDIALAQNPDLIAQRQAEGVGVAALGVAETYPFNPYVQVQATPLQSQPGAGPGTTYHYVLLMQQIQLAGQQQHREQAGRASLNSVRWNLHQAELQAVVITQRLYFMAVYQRGLRDLAKLNAENNAKFLQVLEGQLKAGTATEADLVVVRLDARSSRQQFELAEANYQTALLDLRRQLLWPVETPLELDDNVIRWNWIEKSADQLAMQSASRPDVLAAHADLDTARANQCLAEASRVPDLQIGPYYQRTQNGGDFLGFRGQIDLPVINTGMPLVRQREAEFHQRAMIWNQLQTRAAQEARAAANRYERARRLIAEFRDSRDESVPIALQRLEEQFEAGEVDVVRVIQARMSIIQNRRADLDSLNELMQAAANVTAAAAVPVESLTEVLPSTAISVEIR